MAIVFQLFCAEDLARLTPGQLDDLRTEILKAVEASARVEPIRDRARTVFDQLTQNPAPQPTVPESSRTLLKNFFTDAELGQLDSKQRDILEWAIYCAVTHEKLALEAIREQVYDWYGSLPQMAAFDSSQIPRGGDADYMHILTGRQ